MQTPQYNAHTKKDLVGFSRVMGVFFALLTCLVAYLNDWQFITACKGLLITSIAWFVSGLAIPSALKPLFHGWMWFAYCLNFVMTRLILMILFYGIMMPISFMMRLAGKDPLLLRTTSGSYWKVRTEPTPSNHFEELYTTQQGKLGGDAEKLLHSTTNVPTEKLNPSHP